MFNLKFNVMKKIIFSLMTLFALALMAGSAKAQTSTTPYPGGTYTYTLNSLDDVGYSRTARVFLKTTINGEFAPDLDVSGNYTVTSAGNTVVAGTQYVDITVPANTTSLTFAIAYDASIATGAYELHAGLYDGSDTECYNFIFMNITVTENDFDLGLTADAFTCQVINSAPLEGDAASDGQSTTFSYTATKIGGSVDSDWSFDLDLTSTGVDLDFDDINAEDVTILTGPGTNSVVITGTTGSGDYNVKVTNSDDAVDAAEITITFTIPTTTSAGDAPFLATISAQTLYNKQTSDIIFAGDTTPGNEAATVTVKNLPAIGGFVGN